MKTQVKMNDEVIDLLSKIAKNTKGTDLKLSGLDINHKSDANSFGERLIINIKLKFGSPNKPERKQTENIGFVSDEKNKKET